jgi:hypothetical protein
VSKYKYQCNECYSDCNKNSEEGCFTNEPSDLFPTSCIELEWGYEPKWKEVNDGIHI